VAAVWPLVAKPLIGAGIGWFTNWLAIHMLFRPRRARRILGLTVQGVVPRRRGEIARGLASAFERELFSHEDIRAALENPEYQEALRQSIQAHLHQYLTEKVEASPRLVRALVGEGLVERLAAGGAQEVMRRLPGLLEDAARELEARCDIRQVVRAKIEALDPGRLEALVCELSRRELRFIEILGGVVGFLVGAAFAVVELFFG
jgi:uncharacterized membrane protein YheB (UPF0754 family)